MLADSTANRALEPSLLRRAYELGRLRASALRALPITLVAGAIGVASSGWSALYLLPITFAVWLFVHWRGLMLLRGAFYGFGGGVVTSFLPLSVLRPCCALDKAPGVDCCTMPGACLAAGVVVGLLLAAVVPYTKAGWWWSALGVALGMASVAVLKCASLFAGEALGLLGGLLAGVVVTSVARGVIERRWGALDESKSA